MMVLNVIVIIITLLVIIIGLGYAVESERKSKRRRIQQNKVRKTMDQSENFITSTMQNEHPRIDFTAIDLETATSEKSSICEIGIAVVEDSQIVKTKSWYVRPPRNEYDYGNTLVHGISPDRTENSPEFPEVWKEVKEYLTGRIVVAHNTSFDMYAIRDALDNNNIGYPDFNYVCSCRSAKYAMPGLNSYSLENLCRHFEIHNKKEHSAGYDAEACAKVFIKTIESCSCTTIDEFITKHNYKIGKFGKDHTFIPFSCSGHKNISNKTVKKDKPKKKIEPVMPKSSGEGDPTNYFYSKTVCFTGKCSHGLRTDLEEMVAEVGGIPVSGVSKKTNVLVVGQQDYRLVGEDGMSTKQEKAMALQESGHHIEVMSEEEFLEKIKKQESQ